MVIQVFFVEHFNGRMQIDPPAHGWGGAPCAIKRFRIAYEDAQ